MKDLHEAGRMPIFIANFILAVTLFSIKINSIMKCLGNEIDGSLYV